MLNRCSEGLHRQISLWLLVWSLFALIGCPFWCDNTSDSPFTVNAAPPAAKAQIARVHRASAALPHSVLIGFDFDEFCQCACQQTALSPSSSYFDLSFVVVTNNPRPIAVQSAFDGRGPPDPDLATLRSTSRRSSLLGRAPPSV
ncbi:hypothetical protein [Abditibacterium utsteinense]|nr:hypothetical protein [Abditibacterium utsteinense]